MAETKNERVTRPYIRDMRPIKNFTKIDGEIIHLKLRTTDDTKLSVKDITETGMVSSFKLVDLATDSPYHDIILARIDWREKEIKYRLYNGDSGNHLMELSTPIVEEDWKTNRVFLAKILTDLVGSELLKMYFADRDIPF